VREQKQTAFLIGGVAIGVLLLGKAVVTPDYAPLFVVYVILAFVGFKLVFD
jgi:hypothetical protein